MALFPDVKKRIHKYMQLQGFRAKGNRYFRIVDNIAFCISFEQPTSSLYCYYYILPLYIPTSFHYHTYGNQLEYRKNYRILSLQSNVSDSEISKWTEELIWALDSDIIPFFDTISDAESLYESLESKPIKENIKCPPDKLKKLKLYTAFYLRKTSEVPLLASDYKQVLQKITHLRKDIIEREIIETDNIVRISQGSSEDMDAYLEESIAKTRFDLFGV